MFSPPGYWQTLEGCNQLFDGGQGQDGRVWTGSSLQIGARDRNVHILAGKDSNLTMPHVAWQPSEAGQRQCFAVERVGRISDRDTAFACLRDERGITLGGVYPHPAHR